ncbi:MAG: O-antigen ligase family protein [Phreatobacter sp.]
MTLSLVAPASHQAGTALWARAVARWLPAVMLLYGLLIWPLIYGRSPDTGPAFQVLQSESSALSQIYFPFLFLVAGFVWLATSYRRSPALRNTTIVLMALLMALFVMSVAWSIVPGTALRRVVLQGAIVATLVLSVVAADDPRGVVDRIFWMLVAIVLINVAMVAVTRPGPLGYEGVYPQKNGLGAAAALAVIAALHQIFAGTARSRAVAVATLVLAVGLLILSKSKTSLGLAVMIPALALAVCVAARAARLSVAAIVAALFGLVLLVYSLGVAAYVWDFSAVAEALFGDPTLTTRTDIWDFALDMASRRPVLGYGFESFWQAGLESPSVREAPGFVAKMPHAHNGYIDIMIQTGFVGLGLLVVMLASAFHTCGRVLKSAFGLGTLCVMLVLFACFYNFLESAWFRGFDFISMAFVIAVTLAASEWERARWRP